MKLMPFSEVKAKLSKLVELKRFTVAGLFGE